MGVGVADAFATPLAPNSALPMLMKSGDRFKPSRRTNEVSQEARMRVGVCNG